MMYDPAELIGRYFLTGLILWGALTLMLIIRLLWQALRSEAGVFGFLTKFGNIMDDGKGNRPVIRRIIEDGIFWPYGMVMTVFYYMKIENRTIHEISKTE